MEEVPISWPQIAASVLRYDNTDWFRYLFRAPMVENIAELQLDVMPGRVSMG